MSALVIIDVQKAIDHPQWQQHGPRNNPAAELCIARLLETWRELQLPIYHVRHDSRFPESPYRAGQRGHDFKFEADPLPGETIVPKQFNSAFIGTNFEQILRQAGQTTLVMAGVTTNNSVEATVRMSGNLEFETYLIEDACFTFARPDWNGRLCTADEVHALSLANLHQEYCTVVTAEEVLWQLQDPRSRIGYRA